MKLHPTLRWFSGLPLSATIARSDLMKWMPGAHASTFGGNPLGAAVAREALKVLVEEKMIENSASLGAYALERLQEIRSPHIQEVRGRGLWIGIELNPQAGGARRFCEQLAAEGILCKETHTHVIRVSPPLVISRQELDWALDRFEKVLMRP